MSNPTRSASMGRISMTGNKKEAVSKRPQYMSPTVLTYPGNRLGRDLEPGKVMQGLRPKNA